MPTDGFGPLTLAALGRLFEMAAELHLTEDTLALHFLFQGAEGLIDVVVADLYVHGRSLLLRGVLHLIVMQRRKNPPATAIP